MQQKYCQTSQKSGNTVPFWKKALQDNILPIKRGWRIWRGAFIGYEQTQRTGKAAAPTTCFELWTTVESEACQRNHQGRKAMAWKMEQTAWTRLPWKSSQQEPQRRWMAGSTIRPPFAETSRSHDMDPRLSCENHEMKSTQAPPRSADTRQHICSTKPGGPFPHTKGEKP